MNACQYSSVTFVVMEATQNAQSNLKLKPTVIYLVNYKTTGSAERNLAKLQAAKSGILFA